MMPAVLLRELHFVSCGQMVLYGVLFFGKNIQNLIKNSTGHFLGTDFSRALKTDDVFALTEATNRHEIIKSCTDLCWFQVVNIM